MKKDPFKNHVWTIIQLEGYCLIGTVFEHKYHYKLDGTKVPNPKYDPNAIPPEPPDYCPGKPQFVCLDKGCNFFGYCEYSPSEDENEGMDDGMEEDY